LQGAGRHGLLLLDKKSGLTSFESLANVKKAFSTGKVGHTGTLDKFASGLLVILVGKGVKLIPLFDNCAKAYTAKILFGEETDTLDPEGKVIAEGNIPSKEELEAVLDSFRGEILQAPPAYSAIHIEGRRAHELSREGKEIEMKKRPVTIYELEILSFTPPEAEVFVRCSSGTYIRSLARDLALAAGSRARLSSLRRTELGPFRLEDAIEGNIDKSDVEQFANALCPLDRRLFTALSLPFFYMDEKAEEGFRHGKTLENILMETAGDFSAGKRAGVFRKNKPDELLGYVESRGGKWVYGHVFATN
jgi:tRNA pseudouridine55 synthase